MRDRREFRDNEDKKRAVSSHDHQVHFLAEKMHVSEDEIRRAIAEVGNDREKIERYLNKNR